jgi:2-polyprenyl-3-methyl-5-hydroxy-6-metoxy-1,4-benzoquinol methylase
MVAVSLCPVCNSNQLKPIFACKDFSVSHETFQIVQCQSCDLRLTSPRPDDDDLDRYYQSNNYISHKKEATSFLDYIYKLARVLTLRQKLTLVKKWCSQKPETILDYGCGTGAFLQKCKEAGLKTLGVEPSTTARQIANQTGKLEVMETLDQITSRADAITLWHVLEHVPNLNITLSNLKNRLTENGTMFIAVPNHESYDVSRAMGRIRCAPTSLAFRKKKYEASL